MMSRLGLILVPLLAAAQSAQAFDVIRGPSKPVLLHCDSSGQATRCADASDLLPKDVSDLRGARAVADGAVLFGAHGEVLRFRNKGTAAAIDSLPTLLGTNLTAVWTSPDGALLWAGDSDGVVYAAKAGEVWREVARLVSATTGVGRAVTGGWASSSRAMWITAGDTAHLMRWSPDGGLKETKTLIDTLPRDMELNFVGVTGVDQKGSRWVAALVDDVGRMVVVDSEYMAGTKIVLPPFATRYQGKLDVHGEDQIYRGLFNGEAGEVWATAWYGRIRRVLLSGDAPASRQCGAGKHGCLIEPSLIPANDLQNPKTKSHLPVRVQLSLDNANAVSREPSGSLWVAGDNGLLAEQRPAGDRSGWRRVVEEKVNLNYRSVWPATDGMWVLGEELCPGRNTRPTNGVARLLDFHRPEDPDFTNAFRCAMVALCPNHTKLPCGGVIEVPSGTFPVSDTITVDAEIQIAGQGESTVIQWAGSGKHPYGGMKPVFDIRGRPRGPCTGGKCRAEMIFPPASSEWLEAAYVRNGAALHDLVLQSAPDACTRTGGRSDALGIDLHFGYEALVSSTHDVSLRNLKLCGFEGGMRLASIVQNGTIQRVQVINNHVGIALENPNQWNLDDVEATRNGLGILMNDAEVSFHGLHLIGNEEGGMLVTRGYPVMDSITARENAKFDLAFISGKHADQKLMIDMDAGRKKTIEPLIRQGSRRINVVVSNMALLGGPDGAPGRILVVSPKGDGGRCGVGRISFRDVGGPVTPVLDVMDECPATTQLNLDNARLTIHRSSGPSAAGTLTAVLPGLSWGASKAPKTASASMLAFDGGPGLQVADNGRVRIGGVVMPEAANTSRPSGVTVVADAAYPKTAGLWVVGAGGSVGHFDGHNWTTENIQGEPNAIWSDGVETWIVGKNGLVLWRTGPQGFQQIGGLPTSASLNAIWGLDAKHLWVVGDEGVVLRWDGESWKKLSSRTTASLRSLAGYVHTTEQTCSIDLWAVGDGGAVLRASDPCDGEEAAELRPAPFVTPGKRDFTAVIAPDEQDVFLAAMDSRLLQATLDARTGSWSVKEVGNSFSNGQDTPESLWGVNTLDGQSALVLAGTASGDVLQYDPRTQTAGYVSELPRLPHPMIWGGNPGDIWAAGAENAAHWDGLRWTSLPLPFSKPRALTGEPSMPSLQSTATAIALAPQPNAGGGFRSQVALKALSGTATVSVQAAKGAGPSVSIGFDEQGTASDAMHVDDQGRVGIGTGQPAARLSVKGAVQVDGAVTGAPILAPVADCGPGPGGRLVMLSSGLVLCGSDGKAHPVSR